MEHAAAEGSLTSSIYPAFDSAASSSRDSSNTMEIAMKKQSTTDKNPPQAVAAAALSMPGSRLGIPKFRSILKRITAGKPVSDGEIEWAMRLDAHRVLLAKYEAGEAR
jgi:hypothetical protein